VVTKTEAMPPVRDRSTLCLGKRPLLCRADPGRNSGEERDTKESGHTGSKNQKSRRKREADRQTPGVVGRSKDPVHPKGRISGLKEAAAIIDSTSGQNRFRNARGWPRGGCPTRERYAQRGDVAWD